jgi:hypothetical protein
LKHHASSRFWSLYGALPEEIRSLADKDYLPLKSDPKHPSLHFKRLGELWSVRVGAHYRALGTEVEDGIRTSRSLRIAVMHPEQRSEQVERLRSVKLDEHLRSHD